MKGCVFCEALKQKDDEKALILYRGQHNFVLINRYPYTTGHLMIAPYRHLAELDRAQPDILEEVARLVPATIRILKKVYRPHGFNLGMNLGQSAGAGVVNHFHLHLVPRWMGDSNFMPIIGETRIFCEDLLTTYQRLKPYFAREEKKQEK
ncbi:MAG TPA: HIT domain-containing protein [Candidatus Saccharicenans sp.]|nr:HIT domain-containing protein [Candidatus Saccharicenans sp.]HQO76541.1 HIT domain-containing protein [Candidatus Saccharicenans sp.]HUM79890.1 HIT domain-containing protein [Candidatus Saccharicenans sp.]